MVNRLGVTVVEAMEITQVVTAKSQSAMGASSHPAFMNNCLTISHTYYPYLLSREVALSPFEVAWERGWCGHGECWHFIL